jgi:hypothetical protein
MTMSLTRAPEYKAHRTAVAAVDSSNPTTDSVGIQCREFQRLHVQVIPSTLCNPSVEVIFWSEAKSAFISAHTALAFAGKGAGVAYEFTVDVEGRLPFVKFTTLAAGTCNVHVAGWRHAG